jgi:hypothetical protein
VRKKTLIHLNVLAMVREMVTEIVTVTEIANGTPNQGISKSYLEG